MFKKQTQSTPRLQPIMRILSRKESVIRSFITRVAAARRANENCWLCRSYHKRGDAFFLFISLIVRTAEGRGREDELGARQPPSDTAGLPLLSETKAVQ